LTESREPCCFAVAADPNAENEVFIWEEFADGTGLREHVEHDFFRALQLELAELLEEPAGARPLPDLALTGAEC
jgi:quinol monooxygenase YgiN